ncbi:hypothetical protein LEP1GSC035_1642 [Leptospira noguchii str. 2007001578]|nr:hypothetical protein LEP1GSC035_1642 [Leptospira noguchii str. 2007001578]
MKIRETPQLGSNEIGELSEGEIFSWNGEISNHNIIKQQYNQRAIFLNYHQKWIGRLGFLWSFRKRRKEYLEKM